MTTKTEASRREFLQKAGIAGALAVGIYAFPAGKQIVEAVAPGVQRVTRSYPKVKIARLSALEEGVPFDFLYPLLSHNNFAVKLGKAAVGGVGDDKDVVAFSYFCSHMGCPLNEQYKHKHSMMGPCPCHFSTFDLSKAGTLILGQATQSLPQIVLEVDGSDLLAVGVSGLVYGYADNVTGGTPVKPLGGE
jgi:arsenite oxidase small subunit